MPSPTHSTLRTVAALAAAALALAALAATPEDYAVAVDDLQATSAGDGIVDVDGAISWSGAVELHQDQAGDATVPGIGTDMTSVHASREMGSGVMSFTMLIADGIPTHGGPNEVINWGVPLTIGSDVEVDLQAWRSAQWQRPESTEPFFSVNVCTPDPDTGTNTCTTTEVGGEFTDEHIRWHVPLGLLGGADSGDLVTGGQAWAAVGVIGLAWFTGGVGASDLMSAWMPLHVPGEVELTLTQQTPDGPDEIVATARVDAADGPFTHRFFSVPAGDYTVTATTCFRAFDECATDSAPVTVS